MPASRRVPVRQRRIHRVPPQRSTLPRPRVGGRTISAAARGTLIVEMDHWSTGLNGEARVRDNSRAIAATMVGAVVGGMAGYLFFTEHGRFLRRQIEPALEDIA